MPTAMRASWKSEAPHSLRSRRAVMLLFAAALLVVSGCGAAPIDSASVDVLGASEVDSSSDSGLGDPVCQGLDGQGRTVGYGDIGDIPFGISVREGIVDVAQRCNLEVTVLDNALDGATAVANAAEFNALTVDAVIEFQVDSTVEDDVCEELGDRPVIAIDIAHPTCAVFMGADNAAAGELAGAAAGAEADARWKCEVDAIVTMENTAAGQVNIDRINGGLRGVKSVCGFLNLGDFEDWDLSESGSIIDRLDTDFVDIQQAATDWVANNPDSDQVIVVCINDDSCLAFAEEVANAGREGQFLFVSQGADPSVREAVRENPDYLGSTGYFPEKYGELLVPAIIRMMDGEEVNGPLIMDHVFINADVMGIFYPSQ